MNNKTVLVLILLVVAVLSRIVPHYPNFTAIGATAILSGALLNNKFQSFVLPLLALFVSDLVLNNLIDGSDGFMFFYEGAAYTYIAVALIAFVGIFIKDLKPTTYAVAAILASLIFFLVTNFGVWKVGLLYNPSNIGLLHSYVAAIPFALTDLAANLMYGVAIAALYKLAIGEKNLSFSRV